MDMFRKALESSLLAHKLLIENEDLHAVARQVAETMIRSLRGGGRVLFCGNGGSAADAQHLAANTYRGHVSTFNIALAFNDDSACCGRRWRDC